MRKVELKASSTQPPHLVAAQHGLPLKVASACVVAVSTAAVTALRSHRQLA